MASPTTDRRLGLSGNTAIKTPVDVATTVNVTLSGEQTIDGVLTSASRVLAAHQTDPSENGIYRSDTGAWVREPDSNGVYDFVEGTLVMPSRGSQAYNFFQVTAAGVIGTDPLTFAPSTLQLPSLLSSVTGASLVGYSPYTDYLPGQIGDRFSEIVNVGNYSSAGSADTVAFLDALSDAKARVAAAAGSIYWHGVGVMVPDTKNWVVSTLIAMDTNGIFFYGVAGRSKISRAGAGIFDIGDHTDTNRIYYTGVKDLILVNTDLSNVTAAAITMYRTVNVSIHNVRIEDFYIHYDGYRCSTLQMTACRSVNAQRTANALAFMRFQGTDEVGEAYTPGGGIHITDFEGLGARTSLGVEVNYTEHGVLLMSADGFYVNPTFHVTGCKRAVTIAPDASAANHNITDIRFIGSYFDEPSVLATDSDTYNVSIEGAVGFGIAIASGGTANSLYQNINFIGCYGRGSQNLQRCMQIKVSDPGGLFFAAGRAVRNIKIVDGEWRQATLTAIQAFGATAGAFFEVESLLIKGNYFADNNSSGGAGIGSALVIQGRNATIQGNVFATGLEGGATDYIVSVNVAAIGSGDATNPALIEGQNDFTNTAPAIKPVVWTTQTGAVVQIGPSLYPGPGQEQNQTYKLTTNSTAAQTIWSHPLPSDGAVGHVSVKIVGGTSNSTAGAILHAYTGFYRTSTGGSSIGSTSTPNFITQIGWTYGGGTLPTAVLSTANSLDAIVAGSTGRTYWTCHVDLYQNR